MITKERLEELIEQGATIYFIYGKYIEKKQLKHKYHKFFVCDNELNEYNEKQYIGIWKHKLSKLYETKEEAEWHKEFGCIERTERLELPTWEEFLELNRYDNCASFLTKYNERYCILIGNDIYMHNDMPKPKDEWTIVIHNEDDEYIFEQPATKENYYEACRKAKELFLGEKK